MHEINLPKLSQVIGKAHCTDYCTMKIVFFLIILCAIGACTKKNELPARESKRSDTIVIKNQDLMLYLSTLDKVELPVTIRGCDNAYSGKRISEKGKEAEIPESNSFFKHYQHPYGQFLTTENFSAIITFGLADCLIPEVVTFDTNGEEIDRKSISIGYCGSDCGYSCREFMNIGKDFTLYTSDTIQSYDCDSLGNTIPETEKNYVIYKQGKILPSGKIELSEEQRKELPNNTQP